MIDESANDNFNAPSDEVISGPEIITDLVADVAIPGISGPVRSNFLKAFGQLCSAAIDIPVAYLTGKADELRAETAARIKLTNVSANQIAQQMRTDPEYARIAVQKFDQRVLREQVNKDLITQKAAMELQSASDFSDQRGADEVGDTINDDWLNTFEAEARQMSTEEMQMYFAKVLAGEITKPGSYSRRTVKILGSLDHNVATHFVRLSSMCISILSQDVRVPSLDGNAGENALEEYGLDFDTLNLLNEHGLVISVYNSQLTFAPCLAPPAILPGLEQQAICIPLSYQGKHWILMPISNDKIGKKLRIGGVALTQSGKELFRIVQVEPIDNYSKALAQFFEGKGLRMIEVADGNPRVVDVSAGRVFGVQ